MATYKVIQDIEAEDHILGPLTLRQFIYSLVAALFLYLSFVVVTKNVPFLLVLFLPPGLLSGFLAFPFKRDQPTEVWALAKIGFLLKPRKRIWSQSGTKHLVTITVPRHIETNITNGLSQTEVESRLRALAMTIDTRGWAIKNAGGMPSSTFSGTDDDRLINANTLPKPVPEYETSPEDDILDEQNNPLAIQMSDLVNKSSQQQRQRLIDSLKLLTTEKTNSEWFGQNESDISSRLKELSSNSDMSTANLHTLKLKSSTPPQQSTNSNPNLQATTPTKAPSTQQLPPTSPQPLAQTKTSTVNPDILNLAKRDDLNITTLAREAEVVIKLH
jgi:hypothetical protein